ncbi:hypothetical protein M8494_12000 [Serratia ureilytica]
MACAGRYHAPARAAYTVLLLDLPQGPEAIICMLAALQLKMPFVNLNAKGWSGSSSTA